MKNFMYLCFAVITFPGCFATDNKTASKKKEASFPVIRLIEKDTVVNTDYVATIQAIKNVDIRAKIGGAIEKILVDEGETVKKGQSMFILDNRISAVELERAEAQAENMEAEVQVAKLDLDRIQILLSKKIVSKSEQKLAEAKLRAAKAKLREAQTAKSEAEVKLSYTTIRAPFSGIINRIPLKEGSLLNAGQLLTSISELDHVYAYFDVSEVEYLKYLRAKAKGNDKQYKTVTLELADGISYPFAGTVETIESEIDNSTGSIAFRAKFPNPQLMLKHGSSGKISLTSKMNKALLIPQKSVFEVQDKNYVFCVNKDSTITMKDFVPALKLAQYYVVRSGLEAGETIILAGIQNVSEGMKIRPEFIKTDSIFGKP